MSLYLPTKAVGGKMTIGICPRCQKKMHLGDMVRDPNNGMWVCRDDQDVLDPYRLPARRTERINVDHPRPDVTLELE